MQDIQRIRNYWGIKVVISSNETKLQKVKMCFKPVQANIKLQKYSVLHASNTNSYFSHLKFIFKNTKQGK